MARILGIGIATLDIINTTEGYPKEDEEVRALSQSICRGGNVTNTLTVLHQLGHGCEWAGTLADDVSGSIITSELQRQGMGFGRCTIIPGGRTPTSYITLNKNNGSRTIVHFRDLPEYSFENFYNAFFENSPKPTDQLFTDLDWLHIEARNIPQTIKILDFIKQHCPQLTLSIEIEKPREQIEKLYAYGDVVLFSRHFATSMGHQEPASFLRSWRPQCSAPVLVCPWGTDGAYAIDSEKSLCHAAAVQIPQVVDTIGAGDTFNAGFIHATLAGLSIHERLRFANMLAGKKCSQRGFDKLTETITLDTTLRP